MQIFSRPLELCARHVHFSPRCLAVFIGTSAELWSPMGDRDVMKWHTAFEKIPPLQAEFLDSNRDTKFQYDQAPFPIGRSMTPANLHFGLQISH
jgi:hypothetical protein